jgi:hypothetical protein
MQHVRSIAAKNAADNWSALNAPVVKPDGERSSVADYFKIRVRARMNDDRPSRAVGDSDGGRVFQRDARAVIAHETTYLNAGVAQGERFGERNAINRSAIRSGLDKPTQRARIIIVKAAFDDYAVDAKTRRYWAIFALKRLRFGRVLSILHVCLQLFARPPRRGCDKRCGAVACEGIDGVCVWRHAGMMSATWRVSDASPTIPWSRSRASSIPMDDKNDKSFGGRVASLTGPPALMSRLSVPSAEPFGSILYEPFTEICAPTAFCVPIATSFRRLGELLQVILSSFYGALD